MMIQRWQASIKPSKEQLKILMSLEGLEVFEEIYQPSQKISDHRHPFTEVRIIVKGELFFNVAGNQLLLREGDRIEIPANTKHSHACQGTTVCESLVAQRVV
jgi:quercetin dioxygenase-like cupin family protein